MNHKADAVFVPLNIAVLTVSDTRTLETDTSGQLLVDRLTAAGHQLAARVLLKDDLYKIRAQVATWIAEDQVQVVVITGGTGFTGRDSTPQLDSELMCARIAITNQLGGASVEILLRVTYRLLEGWRHRVVEDFHSRTRPFVNLNPVKPRVIIDLCSTFTDCPDLARLQGIIPDLVICPQLRGRNKLLDAVITDEVAEVGVSKLSRTDTLLLLFDAAAHLKSEARCPLKVFI